MSINFANLEAYSEANERVGQEVEYTVQRFKNGKWVARAVISQGKQRWRLSTTPQDNVEEALIALSKKVKVK